MKNKTFNLLSLSILALLVLTSFASAATLSVPSSLSLTSGAHTFDITVTGTANESVSFSDIASITENGKTITFTKPSAITATGSAQTVTVSYNVPSDFEFKFGKSYSSSISIVASSGNASQKISFASTPFYTGSNAGSLDITDFELDDVSGFGNEDDNLLYPFDESTFVFYVENDGTSKIKDIEIEACVWDVSAEKCVFDEDDMKISNNKFDLKEGKDQKITLTFTPDAEKLKSGNTNYVFYVRAVGEIDDSDSAYDGDETGDSSYSNFEIVTDDEFVIISNIKLNTESVSCGNTVELTADVWNLGDDLDDDEVFVWVYNKELGINKKIEFPNGIDSMESEKIDFTFTVPQNAAEKSYTIRLGAYNDDGLSDDDVFQTSKGDDDQDAVFYTPLTIAVGSCSTTPLASVAASLQSDAKAGNEFTVKATIINAGLSSSTFNLALSGYDSWASLVSMDKTSVTLASGASQDVIITLKANAGASGDQTFNIDVVEGTKSLSQPVSVSVARTGISLPNLSNLFSGNSWIWVIGALNALLVLVIVVVAVKVSRRK
jgi:hypothetical protein